VPPSRSLRVIAWMDEENGGGGHEAYGKDYAAEMPNHIAAIESDAGAAHPIGFYMKVPPEALAAMPEPLPRSQK
jgi:carboxypeptidase Q